MAVISFTEGALAGNTARELRALISLEDVLTMVGIDVMLNLRDSIAAAAVSSTNAPS